METTSAPSRQFGFALTLIVGAALLIAVFVASRVLVRQTRIDPAHFFGEAVPERLRPLLSLQLEGGELAEFFDPASKHKLSVVLAARTSTRPGVLPRDLMQELDRERLGTNSYQEVEKVILKYGAAQFNVLSAGNVAPTLVPVADRDVPAQRFTTTRGAHFLMGLLDGRDGQVFFLALRKGEAVDEVFIGQLLAAMPAARAPEAAAAGTEGL